MKCNDSNQVYACPKTNLISDDRFFADDGFNLGDYMNNEVSEASYEEESASFYEQRSKR
jgi:hypothetical protein